MKKDDVLGYISLIVAIGSLYISFRNVDLTSEEIIYIGIILASLVLYFVLFNFHSSMRESISKINKNSKDIQRLSKEFEISKKFYNIEKDIIIMKTKMDKKGNLNIDPKVILVIIMVFFFYLLLRSRGYLP